MIAYLEGKLIHRQNERIILLAGQVGYEVLLPQVVATELAGKEVGHELSLFIYTHQTERQPKPVLIGFNSLLQREFFERFLTVGDIGPIKAVGALCVPINEIAVAIEQRDMARLKKLKGIGARTALKIVATLHGKMAPYCDGGFLETAEGPAPALADFQTQVLEVLVKQLGHSQAGARQMIQQALARNPEICSPEELLDEVYRKA